MNGPDGAIDGDEHPDLLDREWFADEIVELAMPPNPDWSIRVGIYGSWGSGKTSVMNMVAKKLRRRPDCIVVEFNPWGARDDRQMLAELMSAIQTKVTSENALQGWNLKAHIGLSALASVIKRFSKMHPASETVESVLDLQDSEALAKAMETAVGSVQGRFVVLVDDLDRVRPDMVPPMLFAVHRLLGLNGFTFILAMDPNVVTSALVDHHGGFKSVGGGYLEKIVEYPRTIPYLSRESKIRYAESCRTESARYIPESSILAIADQLPETPRSIRGLFRRLSSFSVQAGRFDEYEFDSVLLLCLAIIDQYSRALWEKLVRENWLSPHMHMGWVGPSNAEKSQYESDRDRGIQELKIEGDEANRMKRTIDQVLERVKRFPMGMIQSRMELHANPQSRPIVLTNREANEMIDKLENGQALLSSVVSQHRWGDETDVYRQLSARVLEILGRVRGETVRAVTSGAAVGLRDRARRLLSILDAIVDACGATWLLVPLLDVATDTLTNTSILKPINESTRALVLRLAASRSATADQLGDINVRHFRRDWSPESSELISRVRELVTNSVALSVVERFREPGAIEALLFGSDPAKQVLDRTTMWIGEPGERLVSVLRQVPNPTVQANALAYFLALADGMHRGEYQREEVDVEALWRAATSTTLGPGYIYRIVGARGEVEHCTGVKLEDPEWWSHQCNEFEVVANIEIRLDGQAAEPSLDISDRLDGWPIAVAPDYGKNIVVDSGATRYQFVHVARTPGSTTFHVRSEKPTMYGWVDVTVEQQSIAFILKGYAEPEHRTSIQESIESLARECLGRAIESLSVAGDGG